MGERTHIGQHLVEPHSSGANGTGDPAILAQIYDPWRRTLRMLADDLRPAGSHGRCRCWEEGCYDCVEEHDTCLTTAITSSQHLRGAAKPISTLQFGEDTWPILETGLSQRCSLPPKEIVFGAARWALAAARGMLPRPTTDSPPQRQRYPKRYRFLEHSCLEREMRRL